MADLVPTSKSELAARLTQLQRRNSGLRNQLTGAPAKLALTHGVASVVGAAGGAVVDAYAPQFLSGAKTSTVVAVAVAGLGYLWDMPEGVVLGAGMIGPAVRERTTAMIATMGSKP